MYSDMALVAEKELNPEYALDDEMALDGRKLA